MRKRLFFGVLISICLLSVCGCEATTASTEHTASSAVASSAFDASGSQEQPAYTELLNQALATVDLESTPDGETQALYVELLYRVLESIDPENTPLRLGARVFSEPTFGYFDEGKLDVTPLIYEEVNGWNAENASQIIEILKDADYRFSKYGRFARDVVEDIAYIKSDEWTLEGVRFENIVYLTIGDICFMYVIYPTDSGVVALYDELSNWYESASGTTILDIYGPAPTMEPQDPDKGQTDISAEECQEFLYQALDSLDSETVSLMIGGSVYPTSPKRLGGPNKVGLVPVSYEEVNARNAEQADGYIQYLQNIPYIFFDTVGHDDEILEDKAYLRTDAWTLTVFRTGYIKFTIDERNYYYLDDPFGEDEYTPSEMFSDWTAPFRPELYDVLSDWYEDASGTAFLDIY